MAEGRLDPLAAIWSHHDGKGVPKYVQLGELYGHGHSQKAATMYDRVSQKVAQQAISVPPRATGQVVRNWVNQAPRPYRAVY